MWSSDEVLMLVQSVALLILAGACHWQRWRIVRLEKHVDCLKKQNRHYDLKTKFDELMTCGDGEA